MENIGCQNNQTKKTIFLQKHKLSIPQPKDATAEIWA